MIVKQKYFLDDKWINVSSRNDENNDKYQLVLVFGSTEQIRKPEISQELKKEFPKANIVLSSTAGEIIENLVIDNGIAVTAISFEKTGIKCIQKKITDQHSSHAIGKSIMNDLSSEDLCGILIISDGTIINGGELVDGLNESNKMNIPIVGGLAGDGANFKQTYTGLNELPEAGNVIAIGFYGSHLLIGHGSMGGWNEFGRERTITKSVKNVLYEIDGNSALKLYKEYLGEFANSLPSSALLFPLSLMVEGKEGKLVRTILGIDDENDCMTFAGNMPEGSRVRLMKSNQDNLVNASGEAASSSYLQLKGLKPQLSILISCVGRKLVMHSRIAEEVEIMNETFGDNTAIAGFYSYGEISPFLAGGKCELHNQTMTITSFTEV